MNLLGGKITVLFGIPTSVAIFITPVTFLITDIVEEVYGTRIARQFVWVGVFALLLVAAYTSFFLALPAHSRFPHNDAYRAIFGTSLRIFLASVTAFLISQTHDVWAFSFWKRLTHGKALWLRNNLSTIVSQAIDTFSFMLIAFYHSSPHYTLLFVVQLALPYYFLKAIFALLDTPFVYLGVFWLRQSAGFSTSQGKGKVI